MVKKTKQHVKEKKLSWAVFEKDMVQLRTLIIDQYGLDDFKAITGIPRGGLPMAIKLSHLLKIPFVPFEQAMYSGDQTLVCDDVSDTGETINQYKTIDTFTFVTWTVKPKGEPMSDVYVRSYAQDVWLKFCWED